MDTYGIPLKDLDTLDLWFNKEIVRMKKKFYIHIVNINLVCLLFKLKGKTYICVVWLAILYGSKCWAIRKLNLLEVDATQMRTLRLICGGTKKIW